MEDYTRLWVRLVWYIQSCPMRIFKWTPEFNPSIESPLTPIWVHFNGLSLYLFEGEGLLKVANSIGKPLRVDSHNVNRVKLGMASVCVELDVSKLLMNETRVSFVDDEDPNVVEGFWHRVEYDSVPPYFSKCFHIGHKVDECKRDMEKEQGRGPMAPYVNRRRYYGTKDNITPAITPYIRRGKVIDQWSVRVYNKSTRTVAPVKESVSITNAFDKLREVEEVEISPIEEASVRTKATHMVDLAQGKDNVVDSKVQERALGSVMAVEKFQLEDLQIIPKDFEDGMGDFSKDFTVRSAPTSPKGSPTLLIGLLKGEELSIQGSTRTEEGVGDGKILDDPQVHTIFQGTLIMR
ncbi:hypothetical protein LIER_26474 [Lithospermum erythrorhizon]|uniref:DUF4283 domain-containing protein n=1 Tax=Lithospermum erythrorhizon TaxID=34254 RepID=A0AAV3R9S3_LITER